MRRVSSVLLIDDSEADNYFHELAISESGIADFVVAMENPMEALRALESGALTPELIFVDINMPGMNGWEFLEAYQQLPSQVADVRKVTVLTTSCNPDDEARATAICGLCGFEVKPLRSRRFAEIAGRCGTC